MTRRQTVRGIISDGTSAVLPSLDDLATDSYKPAVEFTSLGAGVMELAFGPPLSDALAWSPIRKTKCVGTQYLGHTSRASAHSGQAAEAFVLARWFETAAVDRVRHFPDVQVAL